MNEHGRAAGPGGAPPAPWHCRVDAVVWWHRAAPGAAAALPDALRAAPRVPLSVAALVRYADTPVGPYRELAACPVLFLDDLRVAGHVPFIAVDSGASAAAGRALWALPKRLAAFTWPPSAGSAAAVARGGDGSWTVAVRATPSPVSVPFGAGGRCVQLDEHGSRLRFPVLGAGLAAPARARVAVEGTGAPAWLLSGHHPALVLSRAWIRVGRATARDQPARA